MRLAKITFYCIVIFFGILLFHSNALANSSLKEDSLSVFSHHQLMSLGDSVRYSDANQSLYYYTQALEKLNEDEDSLMAITYNSIGTSHYIAGEYDQCLSWYLKALSLHQENENDRGISVSLNNMGVVLTANGNPEEAIEKHNQSLLICSPLKDTITMVRNYFNLGIAYNEIQKFDTSLTYLLKALEGAEQMNYNYLIIQCYNQLGSTHRKLENHDKSIEYHRKVLYNPVMDVDWERSYAYYGLAFNYYSLKDFDKAIAFADTGLLIAYKVNVKYDIQELTELLSIVHAAKGDHKKAYYYLNLYTTYHDSIWNEEKEKEINSLQLKNSEALRIELEKNNQTQSKLLEKQHMLLMGAGAIIILIGLLLIIIYRSNRYKTATNQKLKLLNNEIQKKNIDLNNLNTTRERLFGIIAHDLRGPIGILVRFTEHIQENYNNYDTKKLLEIINSLNKSSRQSYRLLENLLDWAKTQTGSLSHEPSVLVFEQVLEDVIEIVEPNATDKSIKMNYSIDVMHKVYADRNMLNTILLNLINNAIKFTNKEGVIDIYVKENETETKITVKDSGVGMNQSQISNLFNENIVSTTMGTSNEKGTGLGLLVMNEFVKMHNGVIDIQSAVGKGTTVQVKLPKKAL